MISRDSRRSAGSRQPGRRAAGEPFPTHALGPLRAAVEAVQAATQAPVAIPAGSALAAAALAVQGHADVETLAGPRPTSLFVLTVARSGERKSACDSTLLSGLREHEKAKAREQRVEMKRWEARHAVWEIRRSAILAEAKKGHGEKRTAAEADLAALGDEPAAPPSADRTVSEPTFEGLTRLFATGQPSLGVFSDEAGQFLGGHAMSQDNRLKTLAAFNGLWDGSAIRRTRAGEGHSTLYGRRLSVHLMVQVPFTVCPSCGRGDWWKDAALPFAGPGWACRHCTQPPPTLMRHACAC